MDRPSMASSNASLPLHCSVCPRKPTFSDVSHLLTHVASKGHLSHYYKLKVRASHDLTARTLIDQYDHWYDQWSVEELMSERMHQKEKKRSKTRSQEPMAPSIKKERPSEMKSATSTRRPAHLLSVKQEQDASNYNLTATFDSPPPKRARLHLWNTRLPFSHEAIPLDSSSPIPTARSSIETEMIDRRSLDLNADPTAVDEAAKLKGAIWPGMDIFDSATPDMRKKRNQKKDVSVLDQLEQNSQDVEPTEVIYYPPFGVIKKQRRITGRVESSSPEFEDMPPPPKRRGNTRHVLNDRDVNTSVLQPRVTRARRSQMNDIAPRAANAGRRRNATFPVYLNEADNFGRQSGMNTLNSEYRPQSHVDAVSAASYRGYAPASLMPYVPFDVNAMYSHNPFQNPFLQHQQPHYGPVNGTYYGPHGYELSAFLTNHLQEPPYARLHQPQHPWQSAPHPSSSTDGTVESPTDSRGHEGTVTTTVTSFERDAEDTDLYSPAEPALFEDDYGTHDEPIVSLSDLGHDLMPTTESPPTFSQH